MKNLKWVGPCADAQEYCNFSRAACYAVLRRRGLSPRDAAAYLKKHYQK